MKITPRYRADFPEVDVAVAMQVSVTARTRRDAAARGIRPFLIDVALDAVGIVAGHGYDVGPSFTLATYAHAASAAQQRAAAIANESLTVSTESAR